jgi:hypothetical protein
MDSLFDAAARLAEELADDQVLLANIRIPVFGGPDRTVWHVDQMALGYSFGCGHMDPGADSPFAARPPLQSQGWRSNPAPPKTPPRPVQMSLSELAAVAADRVNGNGPRSCGSCFTANALYYAHPALSTLVRATEVVADVAGKLRSKRPPAPVTTLTLLNRLRNFLPDLVKAQAESTSVVLDDALDQLAETLTAQIDRLREMISSEDGRARTFRRIRRHYAGADELTDELIVDETPTLIGFPTLGDAWQDLVKALAVQFHVRYDENGPVVCLVPRFVAEYVRDVRPTKKISLALSADAVGASSAAVEVAAQLWDPEGTGPCRTLTGALATARLTVTP